jgi:hypothetical protein
MVQLCQMYTMDAQKAEIGITHNHILSILQIKSVTNNHHDMSIAFCKTSFCSFACSEPKPVAVAADGGLPAYLMSSNVPRFTFLNAVAMRGLTYV